MTSRNRRRPVPPLRPTQTVHERSRTWLTATDPDTPPAQRRQLNLEPADALGLLAATAFHTAYVMLQSDCAVFDREQGRTGSANRRLDWIRKDAELALESHIDMLQLIYRDHDGGGPAAEELGPELAKASRVLLGAATQAAHRAGATFDLNTLANQDQAIIPPGQTGLPTDPATETG